MAKYRKKPVEVEAEPYKPGMEDGFEWLSTYNNEALCNAWKELTNTKIFINVPRYRIPYINTLEGKHYITPSDYIIIGVKGEKYPCKPDIFEMTYEPVE